MGRHYDIMTTLSINKEYKMNNEELVKVVTIVLFELYDGGVIDILDIVPEELQKQIELAVQSTTHQPEDTK